MDTDNFREVMGFPASLEVMYEDDANDSSIPDIQKITKRNNVMPLYGNKTTMNLNPLVLENVLQSTYTKNFLCDITTFQQVVEEITYNVSHLEPWERGTRRMQGMSGMCGGVRGVGAGGVVSSAFCILYKMFVLRITRKQLVGMINSTQSVYLRGMGFMYIRYTQPPADLWAWYSPYLDDDEEIDPRSGGGDKMTIAQMIRVMFTKLDWFGTLFPRIPVPIQKDIDAKLREYGRAYKEEADNDHRWSESRKHGRSHDEHSSERRKESRSGSSRKRCSHHSRHHHCRKHRTHCPTKAKKARREAEAPDEAKKSAKNDLE